MVTLLFTSVFIITFLVIAAVYCRQKFRNVAHFEQPLPPKPSAGLFSDYQPAQLAASIEEPHNAIIELAQTGDKNRYDLRLRFDDDRADTGLGRQKIIRIFV